MVLLRSFTATLALVASTLVPVLARAEPTAPLEVTHIAHDVLLTLPGTTTVKLPSGRVTTLSVLSAEHEARMLRFAKAAALGAMSRGIGNHLVSFRSVDTLPAPRPKTILLNPKASAPSPSPDPLSLVFAPGTYASDNKYPVPHLGYVSYAADYVAFCTSAKASVCLYIPAGTLGIAGEPSAIDYDPYISQHMCGVEGGNFSEHTCAFVYPLQSKAQYYPGIPPIAKIDGSCASSDGFSGILDPNGFVQATLSLTPGTPQPTTVSCVIHVFAPAEPTGS